MIIIQDEYIKSMVSVRDAIQEEMEKAHELSSKIASLSDSNQVDNPSELAMECRMRASKLEMLAEKGGQLATGEKTTGEGQIGNSQSSNEAVFWSETYEDDGNLSEELSLREDTGLRKDLAQAALLQACAVAARQAGNLRDIADALKEYDLARQQQKAAFAAMLSAKIKR